jgi:hypothetical protein
MTGSLADVLPSVAAGLGLPGAVDVLGAGPADRAVVLLVDGLGLRLLEDYAGEAPALAAMLPAGRELRTTFPSTTATAMASLGTGLPPGAHGIMGTAFWLPEDEQVLQPLGWRDTPHPLAVQPEPTMLERLAAHGVRVTTVSPSAYRSSGLTRAALRGGDYVGADDDAARTAAVAAALAGDGPALVYAYAGDLDRAGHVHGVDSDEWRAALRWADAVVASLQSVLPPGAVLHVTADHGMVDCPDSSRLDLDALPGLRDGVAVLAGEPRARHVYVEAGRAGAVLGRWREALADRALVVGRDEAVEAGWFGEVDPMLAGRIGDVVAVATGDARLCSDATDRLVSSLRGQHGALTDVEVAVPLLSFRAG